MCLLLRHGVFPNWWDKDIFGHAIAGRELESQTVWRHINQRDLTTVLDAESACSFVEFAHEFPAWGANVIEN